MLADTREEGKKLRFWSGNGIMVFKLDSHFGPAMFDGLISSNFRCIIQIGGHIQHMVGNGLGRRKYGFFVIWALADVSNG